MRSRTARFVVLVLLAATCGSLPGPDGSATRDATRLDLTGDQLAGSNPEVRLRKLHLVRPDLIPYPLSLEIYC